MRVYSVNNEIYDGFVEFGNMRLYILLEYSFYYDRNEVLWVGNLALFIDGVAVHMDKQLQDKMQEMAEALANDYRVRFVERNFA